jgi:hypothetical protein
VRIGLHRHIAGSLNGARKSWCLRAPRLKLEGWN